MEEFLRPGYKIRAPAEAQRSVGSPRGAWCARAELLRVFEEYQLEHAKEIIEKYGTIEAYVQDRFQAKILEDPELARAKDLIDQHGTIEAYVELRVEKAVRMAEAEAHLKIIGWLG